MPTTKAGRSFWMDDREFQKTFKEIIKTASSGRGVYRGLNKAGKHLLHDSQTQVQRPPDSGVEHIRTQGKRTGLFGWRKGKVKFALGAAGKLRNSADVVTSARKAGTWVAYKAPHAFWNREGIAGKWKVRNYTTPGTGRDFLDAKGVRNSAIYLEDIRAGIAAEIEKEMKRK